MSTRGNLMAAAVRLRHPSTGMTKKEFCGFSGRLSVLLTVLLLAVVVGGCAPSTPPQGQVLRDAEGNQPNADAAWEWSRVGQAQDVVVEAITVDKYETNLATAIVRYRAKRIGMFGPLQLADCTSKMGLEWVRVPIRGRVLET